MAGPVTALEHELGIARFVLATKRERVETLLRSRRRRGDFLAQLPHFDGWDPRTVVPIFPTGDATEGIVRELRARGAGDEAYVIALHAALDGKSTPLADAVRAVVRSRPSGGVLVSCLPGRLAYWESEHPGAADGRSQAFVLHRER